MTGSAIVVQGNALKLPLPPDSVDLVVTSPPYWSLRSYQDAGEHYEGQLGSEETPELFVDGQLAAIAEMARVLKPTGSIFLNYGDKYAGSGSHNNSNLRNHTKHGAESEIKKRRGSPERYHRARGGVHAKSLMGLPWRIALGATDRLDLWLRAEIIWSKINGIPESVGDRVARTHEQWFHLTKRATYFTGIDEIRQPQEHLEHGQLGSDTVMGEKWREPLDALARPNTLGETRELHPLGKLPGSVWECPSEKLLLPEYFIEDDRGWRLFGDNAGSEKAKRETRAALWRYAQHRHDEGLELLRVGEIDHYAAFPTWWPWRLITGFAPVGICTACNEPRKPTTNVSYRKRQERHHNDRHTGLGHARRPGSVETIDADAIRQIEGYVCSCTPFTQKLKPPKGKRPINGDHDPRHAVKEWGVGVRRVTYREYHLDEWDAPPTRPAVVLDPFGGTGTTALVARALGRIGISVDLSADYTRLARWRIFQSSHAARVAARANAERQASLL